MKPSLSLFSLTLLAIDVGLSSPDPDKDKSILDNPWQSLYTGREGDTEREYYRKYTNIDLEPGTIPDEADTMDLEEVGGKKSERSHRHNPRHVHERKRHQRDQRGVDNRGNSSVTEQTTVIPNGDNNDLVTIDPDNGSQYPGNCTYCAIREANKLHRLEQIRKEILVKLRLDKPPNITDKRLPQIPEIGLWLKKIDGNPANDIITEDPGDPVVRIISMLNLAQTPPPEKKLSNGGDVCYFEFHPDVEPADIISAKLGVFLRQAKYNTETVTMFLLYKMKPKRKNKVLIKRKRIHLNADDTNKWHRFNVDSVVRSWVRNSNNNFGLQIVIFDSDGTPLAIVEPENKTEELYKPYIEVMIREKRNSRERRMTGLDCEEEDAETRCCRYPLVVDFESYGWDWIIQPKRYLAYYCAGECTFAYLMSTTYGHLLQQSSKGSGPCCTPRKMSAISMLYFDQDFNIVYGTLPSMVVDRCGCT